MGVNGWVLRGVWACVRKRKRWKITTTPLSTTHSRECTPLHASERSVKPVVIKWESEDWPLLWLYLICVSTSSRSFSLPMPKQVCSPPPPSSLLFSTPKFTFLYLFSFWRHIDYFCGLSNLCEHNFSLPMLKQVPSSPLPLLQYTLLYPNLPCSIVFLLLTFFYSKNEDRSWWWCSRSPHLLFEEDWLPFWWPVSFYLFLLGIFKINKAPTERQMGKGNEEQCGRVQRGREEKRGVSTFIPSFVLSPTIFWYMKTWPIGTRGDSVFQRAFARWVFALRHFRWINSWYL